jgi:hypothetical protein
LSVSLLIALGGAVAAGLLRGGSLEALAATRFRWIVLLIGGLAIQLLFDLWDPPALTTSGALAVILISNAAVAGFVVMNRRTAGMLLIGVGLVLNVLVIATNNAMPVSPAAADAAGVDPPPETSELKHEELDAQTRLRWLGDIIPVPGLQEVLSIGDLVLAAGVARLVYVRMTSARQTSRQELDQDVATEGEGDE